MTNDNLADDGMPIDEPEAIQSTPVAGDVIGYDFVDLETLAVTVSKDDEVWTEYYSFEEAVKHE